MSIFAWTFLVAVAAQTSASISTPASPEVAARLRACGFSHAMVTFDQTEGEDVLQVEYSANASDEQLACAAKVSLSSLYYLQMPKAFQQRYDTIYWRLAQEQDTASSREWLARRGLLTRLPRYTKGKDAAFAKQLEQLCGKRAKGALQSKFGPHALNPDWLGSDWETSDPTRDKALVCLTKAATAAGFKIGFLGNAYQPGR